MGTGDLLRAILFFAAIPLFADFRSGMSAYTRLNRPAMAIRRLTYNAALTFASDLAASGGLRPIASWAAARQKLDQEARWDGVADPRRLR